MKRAIVLTAICFLASCASPDGSRAEKGKKDQLIYLDGAKSRTAGKMAGTTPSGPQSRAAEAVKAPVGAERAPPTAAGAGQGSPKAAAEAKGTEPTPAEEPAQATSSVEDDLLSARRRMAGEVGGAPLDVNSFTEDDERLIGESTARAILGRYRAYPLDARASVYVRKLGALLVESSNRSWIPYRFIVIDAPEVNAFAAPYGYVFITTGALCFVKNEAELALIIAHEIAHVERKHGLAQIVRGYLDLQKRAARDRLDKMSQPLPDDERKARDDLEQRMDKLSDLVLKGFGLPNELEADRIGLEILVKAGYDPAAAAELWERVGAAKPAGEAQPEIFRSHPSTAERIGSARSAAARSGGAAPVQRLLDATSGLNCIRK